MTLLQIHQGSKHYGVRILFDKASFAVNEGEHIGVVGPNGAGKTTLFKILVDEEHLDSGNIIRSQQLRIGYLEQESEWSLDCTSEQFLQEHCSLPLWKLKQMGTDLGLIEEHFQRPLFELSGGFRMRMKLLYLIGKEPNLMLLDEPTNFLDLETILTLEKFLQSYEGAFLLISHDREFLRRTTESTLEIEAGDLTKFPGNIDDYFEQKTQIRETLSAQALNQEARRKEIQDFVDRFRSKATKARQAQSRLKQLEKMEIIEIKDLPVRAKIQIPAPMPTGKEILNLEKADLGYPGKVILKDVHMRLERGAHLGVVGFNGAGKSTLLKSLAGLIPLLKGTRTEGYQVKLSYFAQHVADELKLEETVMEAFQRGIDPVVTLQEVLNLAGSLLFSGDALQKKIKVLSGGEKSRVCLGRILLQKSPLLLLDEPTNHLDFDTVEALTEALRDYEGTVITVSHDRSFIRRVANQILEVRSGKAEIYNGSYDEYIWSLEKGAFKERLNIRTDLASVQNQASAQIQLTNQAKKKPLEEETTKFNLKETRKRLQSELSELKRKLIQCEKKIKELEVKRSVLTDELLTVKGAKAQQLAKDLGLCSHEINHLEEETLYFMEESDKKQKEIQNL
jgi:ATP-binding cassette subfamily F protein 3